MKEHSPLMSSHYHKTQPCTLRDAASFLQLGLRCVFTSLPLGRLWMVLQCAVQEGMGWGVGSRVVCDTSLALLPGRQQGWRKGSCASALMGCRDSAYFLTREIMWQRQRMDSTTFSPVIPSTRLIIYISSLIHHPLAPPHLSASAWAW